jgi:hypothetical protein
MNSWWVFKIASAFCVGCATGRVKRPFLITNVYSGNMLPASYWLGRHAVQKRRGGVNETYGTAVVMTLLKYRTYSKFLWLAPCGAAQTVAATWRQCDCEEQREWSCRTNMLVHSWPFLNSVIQRSRNTGVTLKYIKFFICPTNAYKFVLFCLLFVLFFVNCDVLCIVYV